jgi:predicted deacylase
LLKIHSFRKPINSQYIYALNPVGISLFNRCNECNYNVNRDFELFQTIQAKLLRKLLSEKDYDYILDLHEGLMVDIILYIISNRSK